MGPVSFAGNATAIAVMAKADFSSTNVLIYPAIATGNVDVVANAMAREVLTNSEGLATGVSYINKEDMQEYQVTGRVVIVAAGACESSRLLLNSKSARHQKWPCKFKWCCLENIYMIQLVLHLVVIFQRYLAARDIMKMALVVCMFIHHGG